MLSRILSRMPKIRNRVVRWLMALPICAVGAAVIVAAAAVVFYGVGDLAYSLSLIRVPRGGFLETAMYGLTMTIGTVAICALVYIAVMTVNEAGNTLFDSAAFKTEKTTVPTTS